MPFLVALVAHAAPAGALVTVAVADAVDDATDIEVVGDIAYVTGGINGFYVVDISDTFSPVVIGSYSPRAAFSMQSVDVEGDIAYVADRRDGMYLIDISDPRAPVPLALPLAPGAVYDVEVAGPLVYLADADAGLLILDLSDVSATFPDLELNSGLETPIRRRTWSDSRRGLGPRRSGVGWNSGHILARGRRVT